MGYRECVMSARNWSAPPTQSPYSTTTNSAAAENDFLLRVIGVLFDDSNVINLLTVTVGTFGTTAVSD
ncbi:hypothetical protein CDAR_35831 [Caerostris darwini]|uniref:Uncharacterized protein n=1 Tax=Caerostris darwini TaxID=1538125 RepID=A0AAV4VBU3_9ARAC|nr:hypothetical protein CDAR_35831 [Caerostris darwini]